MTAAERKAKGVCPDASCWRSVAERVRGEGYRVRGPVCGVVGYGPTKGKAWSDAASKLLLPAEDK